jgi:membrane protease YdiL (CAAX protease family)
VVFGVFFAARAALRAAGVALGGPISTLLALGAVALLTRASGAGPAALGLGAPRPHGRALLVFLTAFAATALCGIVLMPVLLGYFGAPESTGRFDYLEGNLPALLLSIVGIAWFAAAFGEEVVWRGFALPRLAALLGESRPAWLTACVLQAAAFGLLHHSTAGAIVAGSIGLAYGLLFWLGMRNLWPLIAAHAIPDTISLIGVYQGG